MEPLRAIEDISGDVESWPVYLIYDIFVLEPNTNSVKNVAAFMYGNGVPIEIAVDCFIACIVLDSYYVSCAMKNLYCIWDKNPHTAHKARYYSMTLKRWMWINGNASYLQEALWPEVGVIQFGTENTRFQQIIRTTIEHVCSCTTM